MIKIQSEWDFGIDETVFDSQERALAALRNNINVRDVAESYGKSVDQFIQESQSDGMISFKQVLLG